MSHDRSRLNHDSEQHKAVGYNLSFTRASLKAVTIPTVFPKVWRFSTFAVSTFPDTPDISRSYIPTFPGHTSRHFLVIHPDISWRFLTRHPAGMVTASSKWLIHKICQTYLHLLSLCLNHSWSLFSHYILFIIICQLFISCLNSWQSST
jgi:hypothetical protein